MKKKRSWSGLIGLLMLFVGAKLFSNTSSEYMPIWISWMIGPMLWYGGFIAICYWFLKRILFQQPVESSEKRRSIAAIPHDSSKEKESKAGIFHHKYVVVKPGVTHCKLALIGTTMALLMALATSVRADPAVDVAAGQTLFKAKCAMCHGPEADGKTAMGTKLGIRDLHSSEVQKQSNAELVQIVTRGKGKMPSYDGKLTGEQVTQIVSFIRQLGNK